MLINLRGGLGNQIIQIAYVLNKGTRILVNTNAVNLRKQVNSIEGIEYINSKILNYSFGVIRKVISFFTSKMTDLDIFGIKDGYFQYGDITELIPKQLEEHLTKQIIMDPELPNKIDIAIHIRGGDYFTLRSATKVYERCDENYYNIALAEALKKLGTKCANIFIATNDKDYAKQLLNNVVDLRQHNVVYYYQSEWKDFSLIYRASIAIIPNSTFSMTARMLNHTGITFAPAKWFTKQSKLIAPYSQHFIYLDV